LQKLFPSLLFRKHLEYQRRYFKYKRKSVKSQRGFAGLLYFPSPAYSYDENKTKVDVYYLVRLEDEKEEN